MYMYNLQKNTDSMQKKGKFCENANFRTLFSVSSGTERNNCNKSVIYCRKVSFHTNVRSLVDNWGVCG